MLNEPQLTTFSDPKSVIAVAPTPPHESAGLSWRPASRTMGRRNMTRRAQHFFAGN
jgi:hypothetical protein